MTIELRHLRHAVAAARHGSFRRAAEALGVKQSSLSRRISQLEERLGILLFERTSGGVRLTAAGHKILITSRYLVEAVDHLAATAREMAAGEAGHLTVGFYTSLSAGNLRASLIEFASRFPDVEIRTYEGPRTCLLAGVDAGRLDVAIVTGDSVRGDGKVMGLWSERIMVALSESHRLASNDIIYWTDLKDETFLFSQHDPGPEIQDILIAKLAAPGERPQIVSHYVSCENIRSLVGAGFGVSLMCEAGAGAAHSGVAYRKVRDGNGPGSISYAAYWRDNSDNPALAHFLSLLRGRYTALPAIERPPAVNRVTAHSNS